MSGTYDFDLQKCVVFDLEVYQGRWCCGFLGPTPSGDMAAWIVDGDRAKLRSTIDKIAASGRILCGYNSTRFDLPLIRGIVHAALDPFAPAQSIIHDDELPAVIRRLPALGVDHIDLSARMRRGRHFASLKTIAANLGRPVLRELPYPPDAVLTDEQWQEVLAYNRVDLEHTWAVLTHFTPELQALAALSQEQGQDLRSTPSARVVEHVFLNAYRHEKGADPIRPEPPTQVVYRGVQGVVRPQTPEAAEWYDQVVNQPLSVLTVGQGHKPVVPYATFSIGPLKVKVGSGGLHSVDSPRVYYETKTHRLVSVDVASYYPSLLAAKGISPRALGDVGRTTYKQILERRLRLKELAKTETDPVERARLDVQATALKLLLNSTFGKLGDSFSTLFDLEAFLAVVLSGQLMLVDLIERLHKAGARVLSANTDGVFIRVRRKNKRWRKVLKEWESDTEMGLEIDPLQRLVILATNRFATLDRRGKIKRKGAGLKGSFAPGAAPNSLVVNDATAMALLHDIPPELTVYACTEPVRFCRVTKRTGKVVSATLLDESSGEETPLPRIVRWYKARDSGLRLVNHYEGGRHSTPGGATSVRLALDLPEWLPRDLDRSWYVREARKEIQRVGGYRHRSRKLLHEHEGATQAHSLGLVPLPKLGKNQPTGSDPRAVTFLWDWHHPEFTTVGTYTGPGVGILVLDIDDELKFRSSVDKGSSPLLAARWRDLDGSLVSVRGEATAEQVRSGRARGKLIFALPADATHAEAIAKLKIDRWKSARGLEVFYGRGVPSVLGRHPDGTHYRLEGELGPAPAWLLESLVPKPKAPKKPKAAEGRSLFDAIEETPEEKAEKLEGLPKLIAEVEPELGKPSVGWRSKELDDRVIWVGRCPFDHESGTSVDGDLAAGYNEAGQPWVSCKHGSCVEVPRVDRELKERHRPTPVAIAPEDLPTLEPTPIAQSMLNDLEKRLVALHIAPTGSGKSYASAMTAALRYREQKLTLIAVPTLRLANEMITLLKEFIPEAFQSQEVAEVFGRSKLEEDAEGNDDGEGDEGGNYPIHEWTKVVVCTHAQLGRRGFSKYIRGVWERLKPVEDKMTKEIVRDAFAILIDEVSEFIRAGQWEISLDHRVRIRNVPDDAATKIECLIECPRSNHSGNCSDCHLVAEGGFTDFDIFGIRQLRSPERTWGDEDGKPIAVSPRAITLVVPPSTYTTTEEIRAGDTTFASKLLTWDGRPLDSMGRATAPILIFRRPKGEERQDKEAPKDVVGNILEFGRNTVLTIERAVDAEGKPQDSHLLAVNHADAKNRSWSSGYVWPHSTCEVRRIRTTDLLGLEQIRRFAARERIGVVLAGATLAPDDRNVLVDVWPKLVERQHPYPSRRIKQVAIVTTEGYSGTHSLVKQPEGCLVTLPLERHGQGLIFCSMMNRAVSLYKEIASAHPTARLAINNDLALTTKATLHAEKATGVYVSYSRGVLGMGANIRGLRFLVANANAFRSISGFTPGELTPEEFERMRAEERVSLLLQNLGRALRGEEGKTVVIVIQNADPRLLDALRQARSIVEGSELPPVFATGKDLDDLIHQADLWLEAGGGEWPTVCAPTKKTKKKGGRPTKSKEKLIAQAEEAIQAGATWREFRQKRHPERQLSEEELLTLKQRFKQDCSQNTSTRARAG